MRGYYVHFQGRDSIGISKKLDMQIAEFSKHFDMTEIEVDTIPRNLVQRVIGLFPTASIARDYEGALQNIIDPDFIYVRRTTCDKQYLNFWKTIKERFPNCKLVIEIFTYPYDKDDFGKWNAWPFLIKEKLYRGKLKKYVDRFVTYSDDKVIFGVPTIITANGIDIDSVEVVTGDYQDNTLRMLGVAHLQRHHGYERLIEGMKEYYKNPIDGYKVYLDIVGDGPEKEYYVSLVDKYDLHEYVTFYPTKRGRDLEDMYVTADIALVSFGMYKLGVYGRLSALKSRECLAKGMALATGCEIDVIDDAYPYAYIAPNDGSTIDIRDMIAFLEIVKKLGSKEDNAKTIRQFAIDNVSMSKVLAPIVEYVSK